MPAAVENIAASKRIAFRIVPASLSVAPDSRLVRPFNLPDTEGRDAKRPVRTAGSIVLAVFLVD